MPAIKVTLYTRPGCHLCDDAKGAMFHWAALRGFSIELHEVNIDQDSAAHERYWIHIPVAMIGEVEAFRHRFDAHGFDNAARVASSDTIGDETMSDLSDRQCVPCRGGVEPLKGEALASLRDRLGGGWNVVDEHHLAKEYEFPDFVTALALVNRIGEVAEAEGHHPEIQLGWGRVGVTIWTHAIDGLTESDFVLAAKIDWLIDAGKKD